MRAFTQPREPHRVKPVDVPHEQRKRYSITDGDVTQRRARRAEAVMPRRLRRRAARPAAARRRV
ncbi:hypothetical protein EGY19_23960 [Burkholderia multivorans]|nr:hypothetical protein EGY19_23960 [Burkholderia multivorans]PRF48378.1 hypothetical protein C6Q04_12135 [Burkholderia multivorans]